MGHNLRTADARNTIVCHARDEIRNPRVRYGPCIRYRHQDEFARRETSAEVPSIGVVEFLPRNSYQRNARVLADNANRFVNRARVDGEDLSWRRSLRQDPFDTR